MYAQQELNSHQMLRRHSHCPLCYKRYCVLGCQLFPRLGNSTVSFRISTFVSSAVKCEARCLQVRHMVNHTGESRKSRTFNISLKGRTLYLLSYRSWWTQNDLNVQPLTCKVIALPLSYEPWWT